ncbi:MAG: MFS transporter [Rhodospirillaceae bacterium]|nr:MFS transporter [Rhodospirillaceae bacterium]|tara:strand:- start:4402 stop:5637 length:1236 start_codon:yes stop_codon:yes gene_type:complete
MVLDQKTSIEVPYGWVIIFCSLGLNTIGLGAPNILFVSLKPIASDLGTLRWVPSFAYSLMMLGAGVGGILMGLWMDRRGIWQPALFGALMIAFGAFMVSFTEGRWTLWIANGLLIGLFGKSAMIAPLIANGMKWFDRRRGLAVAIIASGQGLAGVIWPPIFQHLNDTVGWRQTFLYFGIFAICAMLPMVWLIRYRPPENIEDSKMETEISGRNLPLGMSSLNLQLLLWIAVICCCSAMAMPVVHLVSHGTDLGYSTVDAARLLSVLMAVGFFSRIGFGMLSDKVGPIVTLLIGSASQATMLLVFAAVDSLAGLYVAAALFGLGFAGIMPCYPLIIRLWFPVKQIGWRVAAQYLAAGIGMAIGGWMAGHIFDLTGSYAFAFVGGFAFNLVHLIIVSGLYLRFKRQEVEVTSS